MCDCENCKEKPKYVHKEFLDSLHGGKVCQGCYDRLIKPIKFDEEDFERIN